MYIYIIGLWPNSGFNTEAEIMNSRGQALMLSSNVNKNDISLRSYDHCPSYLSKLDAWYISEEFRAKEKDLAPKIASIQAAASPWLVSCSCTCVCIPISYT